MQIRMLLVLPKKENFSDALSNYFSSFAVMTVFNFGDILEVRTSCVLASG